MVWHMLLTPPSFTVRTRAAPTGFSSTHHHRPCTPLCHHPDAQTAHTTLPQRSHVCIEQLLCTCGCLGPLSLRRTCPPCRTTTFSTRIPMHTPHRQPPPPTMQRSVSARRQRVIGPSTTHSCCNRGILGLLGVVTWCADSACVRILLHLRTSKMPPK
jgi:hypothetical protein